jgi:hypothetical protein
LLIHCDRWTEALTRLTEAGRSASPDDDPLDHLWAEAYRNTGRPAAARRHAERLRASAYPLAGTYQLALTVSRFDGVRAAAPLWRELSRSLPDSGLDLGQRTMGRCLAGWGLGDWAQADRALTEVLADGPAWTDLTELGHALRDLLHGPDAERHRIAPRLAAVAAARDAVRARYAR